MDFYYINGEDKSNFYDLNLLRIQSVQSTVIAIDFETRWIAAKKLYSYLSTVLNLINLRIEATKTAAGRPESGGSIALT